MSDIEMELGVPVPGRVLPRDRWTDAAWQDDGRPFDWARLFGREAPRVVDLGCGDGRSTIGAALARPDRDHLGIDVVRRLIDLAADRAGRRGLTNARFVVGDAVPWIESRFAEGSIDEIDLYHPTPYYNPAELGRQLFTTTFLESAWRVLRPGGVLVVQTDIAAYGRRLCEAVARHFEPDVVTGPWPDAPEGRTRREIVARRKGLTIRRMIARRRDAPRDAGA